VTTRVATTVTAPWLIRVVCAFTFHLIFSPWSKVRPVPKSPGKHVRVRVCWCGRITNEQVLVRRSIAEGGHSR